MRSISPLTALLRKPSPKKHRVLSELRLIGDPQLADRVLAVLEDRVLRRQLCQELTCRRTPAAPPDRPEPPSPPTPVSESEGPDTISHLTVAEAAPLILGCGDAAVLLRWRFAEEGRSRPRSSLITLLDSRLREVEDHDQA